MVTHDILTAVNNVLTLYGKGRPTVLVHDRVTQGQWWVKFEDKDGQWHVEFEGTFTECIDMIAEYERPNPDADLF